MRHHARRAKEAEQAERRSCQTDRFFLDASVTNLATRSYTCTFAHSYTRTLVHSHTRTLVMRKLFSVISNNKDGD